MIASSLSVPLLAGALLTTGCGGRLDAGQDGPHGLLPIDERNPVVLVNDSSSDNWTGEYAFLLANNGGPSIIGIVICSSMYWSDLNANVTGWTRLLNAARESGLEGIPDLTVSDGSPLAEPSDGEIESTVPNRSEGARRIIQLSRERSRPERPVVVLVGTQLTDLADAYLTDPTVVDRVVVVAALGSLKAPGALMTGPNGDLDPWADWIVAQRFKYVQISAFYDQTADVTTSQLGDLPKNALGAFIAEKQPGILALQKAADRITVLTVGVPQFATGVVRTSADPSAGFGNPPGQGPPLVPDEQGNAYVVNRIAAPLAASRLWRMLLEPHP